MYFVMDQIIMFHLLEGFNYGTYDAVFAMHSDNFFGFHDIIIGG